MREDLLYFIWRSQKFKDNTIKTSDQTPIQVLDSGQLNHLSGPDFFNARIRLNNQEWAGNVEIHVKSSDWYAHGHEKDANYDNVILHVVWEDDVAVFRKDNSKIPSLELKKWVETNLLLSYENLVISKKYSFINCENDIGQINDVIWSNWQERLFVERLEDKSQLIKTQLKKTNNDWEEVLFCLLMKNFGLNKNGNAFLSLATHLGFSVVKKTNSTLQLESLFFGVSGLLREEMTDMYLEELKREFKFLKHKFKIEEYFGEKPVFFGLRPSNFPTIRLSQLAKLYASNGNLFSRVMVCNQLKEFYSLFDISAEPYWDTHYNFGKESKKKEKTPHKGFYPFITHKYYSSPKVLLCAIPRQGQYR